VLVVLIVVVGEFLNVSAKSPTSTTLIARWGNGNTRPPEVACWCCRRLITVEREQTQWPNLIRKNIANFDGLVIWDFQDGDTDAAAIYREIPVP
jgi:hypothetical protein